MQAIINFLRGSVLFTVTGAFPERFLNLCAQAGVGFWDLEWLDPHTLRLRVSRRDARRVGPLTFEGLKRLGVVLKRAQYFLTCSGRMLPGLSRVRPDGVLRRLVALEQPALAGPAPEQLSLFDPTG